MKLAHDARSGNVSIIATSVEPLSQRNNSLPNHYNKYALPIPLFRIPPIEVCRAVDQGSSRNRFIKVAIIAPRDEPASETFQALPLHRYKICDLDFCFESMQIVVCKVLERGSSRRAMMATLA